MQLAYICCGICCVAVAWRTLYTMLFANLFGKDGKNGLGRYFVYHVVTCVWRSILLANYHAQIVARQVARRMLHCSTLQKQHYFNCCETSNLILLCASLAASECCETWWLQGMLHCAISRATCVATKLRDKLHRSCVLFKVVLHKAIFH